MNYDAPWPTGMTVGDQDIPLSFLFGEMGVWKGKRESFVKVSGVQSCNKICWSFLLIMRCWDRLWAQRGVSCQVQPLRQHWWLLRDTTSPSVPEICIPAKPRWRSGCEDTDAVEYPLQFSLANSTWLPCRVLGMCASSFIIFSDAIHLLGCVLDVLAEMVPTYHDSNKLICWW